MNVERQKRFAQLASACGTAMRVRILAAMIPKGINHRMTLADLTLAAQDESGDKVLPGPVQRELMVLRKLGVADIEEPTSRPSDLRCWITDDGVFTELAELATEARDEAIFAD